MLKALTLLVTGQTESLTSRFSSHSVDTGADTSDNDTDSVTTNMSTLTSASLDGRSAVQSGGHAAAAKSNVGGHISGAVRLAARTVSDSFKLCCICMYVCEACSSYSE